MLRSSEEHQMLLATKPSHHQPLPSLIYSQSVELAFVLYKEHLCRYIWRLEVDTGCLPQSSLHPTDGLNSLASQLLEVDLSPPLQHCAKLMDIHSHARLFHKGSGNPSSGLVLALQGLNHVSHLPSFKRLHISSSRMLLSPSESTHLYLQPVIQQARTH